MAHLIDKDALLAEIEKRIKAIPRGETDKRLKAVYGNEAFVLHDLFSFIDSLQEEPVSEQNLSNVESTGKNWKEESDLNWKDMSLQEKKDLLVSLQKDIEPVSEDLEEAAIQFATDTETGKVDVVKQSSFFWGAIYHKQQLIAKAVGRLKHYLDNSVWVANDVGVREKEVIIEDFENYLKGE